MNIQENKENNNTLSRSKGEACEPCSTFEHNSGAPKT